MEESAELEIRYFVFVAGSPEDPRPSLKPACRRLARCITCNGTVIAHFSTTLRSWVDDSGRFHTGHFLELPEEWLS
jgi:hypothetical protein